MSQSRFEIQFQPALKAQPKSLHATSDADEATVAFHAALSQLRERGVVGDVLLLLHKPSDERALLLRQPVNPRVSLDEGIERRR